MKDRKIIFTGPVGAGKSTAIATLSDIAPVRTDVRSQDSSLRSKPTTTIAMDYGVIDLGDGERVHLYGTPGQQRFNFMWEVLAEGAMGLIVLINNTRPNPIGDLQFFLDAFAGLIRRTRVAVGITQTDLAPSPDLDDYHRILSSVYPHAPLFTADAREHAHVSLLLEALLIFLDPRLEAD
jgi:signal recognition particle receptor subunit beta